MKKIIQYIIFFIIATLFLTSCSATSHGFDKSFYRFGTVVNLRFYDKDGSAAADRLLQDLELLWDATAPESELSKWNADHTSPLSEKTLHLIQQSIEISQITNGAFDMTLLPISRLWGFQEGVHAVPKNETVESVLEKCGYEKLSIKEGSIIAPEEVLLDLGAVAKGYAADLIADELKKDGCKACVISLGGNIRTVGRKPDGSKWSIAIRDPKDTASYVGTLHFYGERSIVTSGSYQQFFEDNGRKYCHIIDPKTGFPVLSELSSVTVICSDGLKADAYSTALFVMGRDKAIDFYKNTSDFEMILVYEDGSVEISEGIASEFQLNDSYDTLTLSTIERGNP